MAQITIKRSNVGSKVPVVGDLALGELAINTYDGKLFLKKNNGTESIVEIGGSSAGVTGITATTPIVASASTGAVTLSHAASGVSVGTYNNVTVNATGHVTAASNVSYLTAEADTLATVTGRGATTSIASTFSGGLTVGGTGIVYNGSTSGSTTLKAAAAAGSTTITMPATTGTLALTSDIVAAKKQEFIATAAQTTFTITDGYLVGSVQVFANGIALAAADYTATNGTTVVLTEARVVNDNIIVTSGGTFQGGTTSNALTVGTGLALNSGTTFNGSAARTISLATSGVSAQTVGSSSSIPVITVDMYGRITSISTATPSGGGSSNSFSSIYANAGGTVSSPTSVGATNLVASGNDSLYLIAGSNVTITASNSPSKAIMISATGGASSGFTWQTTTSGSFQGSVAITYPTGHANSSNRTYVVFFGNGISSSWIQPPTGDMNTSWSYMSGTNWIMYYTTTVNSSSVSLANWNFTNYGHMIYTTWSVANSSTYDISGSSTSSTPISSYIGPSYSKTSTFLFGSTNSSLDMTTTSFTPASGYTSMGSKKHPSDANLTVIAYQNPTPTTGSSASFGLSNPGFYQIYYAYVHTN
jgi:hypothetical protein